MIGTGIQPNHALDGLVLTLIDRCDRPADHAARLARYDAHRAWIEAGKTRGIPLDDVIYRVLAAWAHLSPLNEEVAWDGAAGSVAHAEGKSPIATEPTAEHKSWTFRRLMRRVRDYYGDEVDLGEYAIRKRLILSARNVARLELMELAILIDEARRPPWDAI